MGGASRIGVKRTPNLRRPPVEQDSTRICELLVGLGALRVLAGSDGVDSPQLGLLA